VAESEIVVRTAEPADAAYLAELGARTFLTAFVTENDPAEIAAYVAKAFSRDTMLQELEDPCSLFLLAVVNGENIGYAKIRKGEPPECVDGPKPIELERIYVDASKQSGGVGAVLMQAVFEHAKEEGYGTVWLGAWEKNPRARRFYEKHGFSAVGSKYFMLGNDRQNDDVMRRILG
jgi:GNAT superfamily N-acetyltransferase